MSKVYISAGLTIEVDKDLRVWLGINDEYYFDEEELQKLIRAYLSLYSSKADDIKTEYRNHLDGASCPKVPWLLR